MAETRCPFCGFSPIPVDVEACPKCRRRFVDDRPDVSTVTATRAGGITGAVTASPAPAAIALVAGATAWLLRLFEVFGAFHEPGWLLALPALLVAVAGSVMAAVGPAKHLPVVLGVVSSMAAVVWPTHVSAHDSAMVAFGIVTIVATVSEPSSVRLKGGAVVAVGAALVATLVLALADRGKAPAAMVSLVDEKVGLRWELPSGWVELEALTGGLTAPTPADRRAVLRAGNGEDAQAFLVLDRGSDGSSCDALISSLGTSVVKASEELGAPFPRGTQMLEVRGGVGVIRAACGATSAGQLALVLSTTAAPAIAESSLRVLAIGVIPLADPRGP
jgi:hypothetical protein